MGRSDVSCLRALDFSSHRSSALSSLSLLRLCLLSSLHRSLASSGIIASNTSIRVFIRRRLVATCTILCSRHQLQSRRQSTISALHETLYRVLAPIYVGMPRTMPRGRQGTAERDREVEAEEGAVLLLAPPS